MPAPIVVERVPGWVDYAAMLERQRVRQREVAAGQAPNTLFLLEHAPVITLGRSAHAEHVLHAPEALASMGIALAEADRGGDVTYHGPGQMVAYPILNLHQWRCSVQWYLRALEESVIQLLGGYGVRGERHPEYTGVWVNGAKVAAIGVGVRQWVTYHGLALNVCPDLRHFQTIVPCGIADKPVTSLHCLVEPAPALGEVMDRFERVFLAHFGEGASA